MLFLLISIFIQVIYSENKKIVFNINVNILFCHGNGRCYSNSEYIPMSLQKIDLINLNFHKEKPLSSVLENIFEILGKSNNTVSNYVCIINNTCNI